MFLVAASQKDIASLNIKQKILDNYPFNQTAEKFNDSPIYEGKIGNRLVKLVTLNVESIYAPSMTGLFPDLELVVFISRHSSISGTPTLSVHTPGNFGEAELGGVPCVLSISPANAMRNALQVMMRYKNEKQLKYDVSYECTHHGPSFDVPTMFVELGSSPAQWSDLEAAEVVAHAALQAISKFDERNVKVAIGIGGPHYNAKFTRLALESEVAFGHMVPKYAIQNIDIEMLKQCVRKTLETVEYAVLDWKGIKGEHKSALVEMLKEAGLSIKKI